MPYSTLELQAELAPYLGIGAVLDDDARLSDARTPTSHDNTKHSETYLTSTTADSWLAGKEVSYAPVSPLTVTTGTLSSGTYADLATLDAASVVITEVSGGTGISATVNFSAVTAIPTQLLLYGNYQGSASHQVSVQIWNYIASAWETLGLMATQASKGFYAYPLFNGSAYVNGSNAAQVRFLHSTTSVAGHTLTLDYVSLKHTISIGGGGGITDHGSLSGLSDPDHTEAAIAFTDNTTGDASTSSHGFFPKLPAATGKYLKDDLTWDTPAGGAGGADVGLTLAMTANIYV
jgi:hypothetical protein